MNSNYTAIIQKAYAGFNSRDIDSVFTVIHPDIHWPKAFEDGYVVGQDAVREYWTRQWNELNPKVEPLSITERPNGEIEVEVYQLVKDLEGNILFDGNVKHVYIINEGLLNSMNIE
ncbi:nuclear transport factor 2 family protein [Mucilaginibacter sp.]